jgi:predicted HNH restriction endonuclease
MGYGEQDFKLCEACLKAEAVDVHHIEPRGMGGSEEMDVEGNLIGLCRGCHALAEKGRITQLECRVAHDAFKHRQHP